MTDDTLKEEQSVAPTEVDTAPAPNNEADVQEQEAPEATQGAGDTSQEVNATDTADERLYAGKYKSIEDLESAYKNAESKLGSVTSEKSELSRILAEAFADDPAPKGQGNYDDYEDDAAAPKADDTVNRKLSVMEFAMSNPDADGAAIMEVLKSDPYISQIGSYEAKLRYAHAISQNASKPKAVAEAKKQAQAETQVKVAAKQAAQVESATKQSPPTKEEPLTRDQIRAVARNDDAFSELMKKNFPGIASRMQ